MVMMGCIRDIYYIVYIYIYILLDIVETDMVMMGCIRDIYYIVYIYIYIYY